MIKQCTFKSIKVCTCTCTNVHNNEDSKFPLVKGISRVLSKFNFTKQTNKQTKRTRFTLDDNSSLFKITTKSKSVQFS